MKKEGLPDLSRKLKIKKKKTGKAQSRIVFESGVPQYFTLSNEEPYGYIPVYDDMTEKDVTSLFSIYKKRRVKYLQSRGIKIRKYEFKNALRDHEWYNAVKKEKGIPDYKKIAKNWSDNNKNAVELMMLKYLWNSPERAVSELVMAAIKEEKALGRVWDSFVVNIKEKLNSQQIRRECEEYVRNVLPGVIRSAVNRYREK